HQTGRICFVSSLRIPEPVIRSTGNIVEVVECLAKQPRQPVSTNFKLTRYHQFGSSQYDRIMQCSWKRCHKLQLPDCCLLYPYSTLAATPSACREREGISRSSKPTTQG